MHWWMKRKRFGTATYYTRTCGRPATYKCFADDHHFPLQQTLKQRANICPLQPPFMSKIPAPEVLRHVTDVHCHPTDSPISPEALRALPISICAMATRVDDQALVRELAAARPDCVTPCFGERVPAPPFSLRISRACAKMSDGCVAGPPLPKEQHYRELFLGSGDDAQSEDHIAAFNQMLASLPDPIPLDGLLEGLKQNLLAFPNAMLGEVGLDRVCRVPIDYKAEPKKLSPFTIPLEHQTAVVEAQLHIAIELGRNVSFHSVKVAKPTLDLLARMQAKYGAAWNRISIDMHSVGLSSEMWKDIERKYTNVFCSLSTAINGRSSYLRDFIGSVTADRILVESDIHEIDQCADRTWEMVTTIADVHGWKIEDKWKADAPAEDWGAVRKLEENWIKFQKGNHRSKEPKKNRKMKAQEEECESDSAV